MMSKQWRSWPWPRSLSRSRSIQDWDQTRDQGKTTGPRPQQIGPKTETRSPGLPSLDVVGGEPVQCLLWWPVQTHLWI